MTRSAILTLITAVGLTAASAPLGAQTAEEQEERQESRSELQEARQALEEAAREVARLSAETAGPVISRIRMIARPAVLGINISDAEDGVRVDGVTPGGPAEESGLATGDIIVEMDGAELGGDSPAQLLIGQMENVSPGDTVLLTIVRDGDQEEVEVIAGSSNVLFGRDDESGARRLGFGELMEMRGEVGDRLLSFRRRWGDMELVELTPELGTYFGTETGILVVRAPSDDELEVLMDGDVILDIGGREPNSTEHALRILASYDNGESLEITIMREQRRQTLEVEIP